MSAYSQLGVTIVIYLKYLVIVSWFDFASLCNTMDSVPNSYIFEIFSYCVSVWICQSLRHNGQCARFCVPVHLTMQWRWKGWEHAPHTNGQSSPGYLHSVQQPSKGNLQIAHNSSFASHVHEATACHWRTFTFILIPPRSAGFSLLKIRIRIFIFALLHKLWNDGPCAYNTKFPFRQIQVPSLERPSIATPFVLYL